MDGGTIRSLPWRAVLAALLVLATGCGRDSDAAGDQVAVRDSAGIRIIETRMPSGAPPATAALQIEPLISIGGVGGPEPYQLYQVADAMRLEDGRIVLANGGTRDVRFYDADGRHLRTIGGAGEGPEEYQYPIRIYVDASDRLVVQDRLDRVYYDLEGEYLDRKALDLGEWFELFRPTGYAERAYWLPDDRLVATVFRPEREPPRPGPAFRPRNTWVRVAGDLSNVDTLGVFGGTEQQMRDVGGRVMPFILPFARTTLVAVGADGVLVVADAAEPEVHRFRADGGHTILRWRAQPEPVTELDIDRQLERRRTRIPRGMDSATMERGLAGIDVPDAKPFSYGVFSGRDGRTWVRTGPGGETETSEWVVFGADGRDAARVTLPDGFRMTDAGADYVLGIDHDPDTGVPFVRVYRLPSDAETSG